MSQSLCVLRPLQVDFWSPESADLVTVHTDVDIHIPASHVDMVSVMLQQSGMDYRWVCLKKQLVILIIKNSGMDQGVNEGDGNYILMWTQKLLALAGSD